MRSPPGSLARIGLLVAALALAPTVFAQAWPSKPVRVIVPAPPGQGADILCRQMAQKLSEGLKQPFTIDNRPGAGGHVATEYAARSAPDGYTVLCGVSSTFVTTPHVMGKLNYDPVNDLAPAGLIGKAQLLLVASPSVPADDLPGLIAWLKANPGAASYASPGVGTNAHLVMEVFKQRAGVSMVHVPYNNVLPVADLSSGRVHLMVESLASMGPHVQSGRVKLIAIASPDRIPEFPKVAATRETVPDFYVTGWAGYFVPAATPKEIVTRLSSEIGRALEQKDLQDAFGRLGFQAVGMPPDELRAFIRTEYDRWGQVVRSANIRPE